MAIHPSSDALRCPIHLFIFVLVSILDIVYYLFLAFNVDLDGSTDHDFFHALNGLDLFHCICLLICICYVIDYGIIFASYLREYSCCRTRHNSMWFWYLFNYQFLYILAVKKRCLKSKHFGFKLFCSLLLLKVGYILCLILNVWHIWLLYILGVNIEF